MFEIITLSNGVRVALETIPFVRSVSFGIWTMTGSRNEPPALSGISHFIEHMLFKGTAKRTAKEIADEMDAIGGQMNAYTTKEYTCYHARVLDTHIETAVDVLADMFFCSVFDPAEIEKERNVILEEINMYEDTPEDLAHDMLQSTVWENVPLGAPVLGTASSIGIFTQETFRDFHRRNYRPENTVIAVAGNFDAAAIIALLEKQFTRFVPAPRIELPSQTIVYRPGTASVEKDVEQLHLCIGFPGVSMRSADIYAVAALNTYFGGGMSSRLFQNVRERHGLVYSVYSYNASYLDAGLFTIYAALNPAQVKDAMRLIRTEIAVFTKDGMTEAELQRTKEQLKSNYILSLESSSSRMSSIGRSELLLNRIVSPDELIRRIDAITTERIAALAGAIFQTDKMSLTAAGHLAGINMKELLAHE